MCRTEPKKTEEVKKKLFKNTTQNDSRDDGSKPGLR